MIIGVNLSGCIERRSTLQMAIRGRTGMLSGLKIPYYPDERKAFTKVKLNFLYFICTILTLIGCGQRTSKIQQNSNQQDSLAENAIYEEKYVTDSNRSYIISYPDTLYLGDTLKIEFKTPHPKDFAITTPDEKFFFVIYAFNDTTKPSLYDWNEFAQMSSIEIVTDKTKANHWDARVTENQIIFNRTGIYELRLSENLETDDGTPVERIEIYYIHAKR